MDSRVVARLIHCNLMWFRGLRLGGGGPAPECLTSLPPGICGKTSGATTLESLLSVPHLPGHIRRHGVAMEIRRLTRPLLLGRNKAELLVTIQVI